VWKTRRVSWVGEIAGYTKGEIRHGNDRLLILKGPILPVAKKGNCSFTQTFLEQYYDPRENRQRHRHNREGKPEINVVSANQIKVLDSQTEQ